MNKNEIENSDLLQHVEPQRRQFLAKLLAGGVALPVVSSIALAQPTQDGKGKGEFGGKGKGKSGGKGKGELGGKGKGDFAGKGKGGFASNTDPAELAAKLLNEFDKDGDKALNLDELTAALESTAQRRGMMGGTGKGKGDEAGKGGAAGKGKGAAGKGKGDKIGKGKGDAQGGGAVKPKRPASE